MELERLSGSERLILFENHEVSAVARAFDEYNLVIKGLANELAISAYQAKVANWSSRSAIYVCPTLDHINDVFTYFDWNTDDAVENILSQESNPSRLIDATNRYRMQNIIQGLQLDMYIEDLAIDKA